MSSCCDPADVTLPPGAVTCPASHTSGKPVELLTVKALLKESALTQISTFHHYFCPDPGCDIVYFDTRGSTFRRDDLRVPVWQKEPFGARMVCYCFGENEDTIRTEIEQNRVSDAVGRVRAHIKLGRCACEIRNPRGVCCLGDVIAAVARVTREFNEPVR